MNMLRFESPIVETIIACAETICPSAAKKSNELSIAGPLFGIPTLLSHFAKAMA